MATSALTPEREETDMAGRQGERTVSKAWNPINEGKKWYNRVKNAGQDAERAIKNTANSGVNQVKSEANNSAGWVKREAESSIHKVEAATNRGVSKITDAERKAAREMASLSQEVKNALPTDIEKLIQQMFAAAIGPVLDKALDGAVAVGVNDIKLRVGIIKLSIKDIRSKVKRIRSFATEGKFSNASVEQFIRDIDPDRVTIDISAGLSYVIGQSSLTEIQLEYSLDPDKMFDQIRTILKKLGV